MNKNNIQRIKIDKDVPMPDRFMHGELKTILKKMCIGDSFYVSGRRIEIRSASVECGIKIIERSFENGYRYFRVK